MKKLLLSNKNFRHFWIASSISIIGDFVDDIAFAELVYLTTKSTLLTSYVFAIKVFFSIISILSATVVDRHSKKNALILTSLFQGTLLTILFVLCTYHKVNTFILLLFVTLQSVFSSFSSPAKNAILSSLVTKDEIVNARSTITMVSQLIQITAYAFSGLLISLIGIRFAILIDALTFFISVYIFSLIQLDSKQTKTNEHNSFVQDVTDGFKFVFTNKPILLILIVTCLGNIFTSPIDSLMPAYFSQNNYDNASYSIFMIAMSIGSFIGGYSLTKVQNKFHDHLLLAIGFYFGGAGMISLFFGKILWLPFISAFIIGISVGLVSIMNATIIQIQTPNEMLGRTFSLFSCISYVASPLGMVIAGMCGEYLTMNYVFVLFGSLLLLTGLFTNSQVHPNA